MKQPFFGGDGGKIISNESGYIATIYDLGFSEFNSANELKLRFIVPLAGAFRDLYFVLNRSPGVGSSRTLYFRRNNIDTALSTTISGTDRKSSNVSDVINVNPGDVISHRISVSGTETSSAESGFHTGITWVGSSKEAIIMGLSPDVGAAATNLNLMGFGGETNVGKLQVLPATGTLKNFYGMISDSAGAGKKRTLTIQVNGTNKTLSIDFVGSTTANSDTTNTVSVNSLDNILVRSISSGSGIPDSHISWGLQFQIENDGDSILMGRHTIGFAGIPTSFQQPIGVEQASTDESEQFGICPGEFTFRGLYAEVTGSEDTERVGWIRILRKNTANTALSVAMLGTTDSGLNVTSSVVFNPGDYINWSNRPYNTPSSQGGNPTFKYSTLVVDESVSSKRPIIFHKRTDADLPFMFHSRIDSAAMVFHHGT